MKNISQQSDQHQFIQNNKPNMPSGQLNNTQYSSGYEHQSLTIAQDHEQLDQDFHNILNYNHPARYNKNNKENEFQGEYQSQYKKIMFLISDDTLLKLTGLLFVIVFFSSILYAIQSQGTKQQLLQLYSNKQLITSDKRIPNYQPTDYYWFSVSIKDLILNSNLDSLYRRNRNVYSMNRDIHMKAILFVQLTHNIKFNGQIEVQMSPFDQNVLRKRKTIEKIVKYQEDYYERKYHISKYDDYQIPFCILVPSYNNVKSRLYLRNLDSIFMQNYKNYHVVYIDDHSPQKTGLYVKEYIKQKNIPQDKIKVIITSQNKKALQNIYEGIHQHCPNGELVGLIDGDDSLLGRQVLRVYNAMFRQKKIAFMYSNFLKITSNSKTEFGFGQIVTKQYFQAGNLRNYWPLVATHFLVFYSDLFKKIQKKDFCYENGTFYDYAYDRAIVTPLIQMSFPHIHYLPEMVYEYRNDTGMNDGGSDWWRVSVLIRQQKPYTQLQQMPFINNKSKIILSYSDINNK